TKAFALERLCRRLGVAPEEVVAVGDMPNDLAMLDWAGTGVAVANAVPEVLDAADEVTAANTEDGVALLLERILAANGAAVSRPPPPGPRPRRGKASGPRPSRVSNPMRSLASATVGMVPAGTHHRAR